MPQKLMLEEEQLIDALNQLPLTDAQKQRFFDLRSDQEGLLGEIQKHSRRLSLDQMNAIWEKRFKTYAPPPKTAPGMGGLPLPTIPPPPTPEEVSTDWLQRGVGFIQAIPERFEKGVSESRRRMLGGEGTPPPVPVQHEPILDFTKLLPSAKEQRGGQTAWGFGRGLAEIASPLTTPENAALLVSLPALGKAGKVGRLASRAVSGFFATQMGKGFLQEMPLLNEAWKRKDWPEVSRIGGRTLAEGVMTYVTARHALRRSTGKVASEAPKEQESVTPPKPEPLPEIPPVPISPEVPRWEYGIRPEEPVLPIGTEMPLPEMPRQARPAVTEATGLPEIIPPEAIPEPTALAKAQRRVDKARAKLQGITDDLRAKGTEDPDLWSVPKWVRARTEFDRAQRAVAKAEPQLPLPQTPTPPPDKAGIAAFSKAMQKSGGGGTETALEPIPERAPAGPVSRGRQTEVRVPGETTKYPVVYSVREAIDVQPSHNPATFQPNPAYQHVNTRDYSDPRNQDKVLTHTALFDREFVLTENPTAEHGAPIIDQSGNVLGGNDRSMTIKRVIQDRPDAYEAYRQSLIERAPDYGIDPAQVAAMEKPVLVREVTGPVDAQRAIADFNKKGAAEYTESERAIAGAQQVSPEAIEMVSSRLDALGEEGTLADALSGKAGIDVLDRLVQDGAIEYGQRASYLNQHGELTVEGRGRIAKMMLAGLFRDADQLDRTPAKIRAKLERAVGPAIRTAARGDWSLVDRLQEALDVLEEARAAGVRDLHTLGNQLTLTGEPRYRTDAIELARVLRDEPTADIGPAFRRYAESEIQSRPGMPEAMFGAPDQPTAFREAFGKESMAERRAEVKRQAQQWEKLRKNPATAWLTGERATGDLGTETPSPGELDAGGFKLHGGLSGLEDMARTFWKTTRRDASEVANWGRRTRKAMKFSPKIAANLNKKYIQARDATRFSIIVDTPRYLAWKHGGAFKTGVRIMRDSDRRFRTGVAEDSGTLKPYFDLGVTDQKGVDALMEQSRLQHRRFEDMPQGHLSDAQKQGIAAWQAVSDREFLKLEDHTVNMATDGRITSAQGINSAQQLFDDIRVNQPALTVDAARSVANEAFGLLEEFRQKRREGYVPFSRYGNYVYGIKNTQTGKKVYWSHSKSIRDGTVKLEEAKARLAQQIASGELEVIKDTEGREIMDKIDPGHDVLEGFGGMEIGWLAKFGKLDPEMGKALQQQYEALMTRMNFRAHLKDAHDIPGYEADFRKPIADYVMGVNRYISKSQGLRDARKAFSGIDPKAKPKLARYASDYLDYLKNPGNESWWVRNALFHYYLGIGNVKFALQNFTQVPFMTAPELWQYAKAPRVAAEIGRAYSDLAKAVVVGKGQLNYDALPVDVRADVKASLEAGGLSQAGFQELSGIAFGQSAPAQTFQKISGALASASETTNRVVSFIAAHRIFRKSASPKLREFSDARAFAEEVVDNTQLAYGRWNRPLYARSRILGVSTLPLVIFRSFSKGSLEFMGRLYSQDKKALAAYISTQVFAAGTMGLPGARDLEGTLQEAYKLMTGEELDLHGKIHETASELFSSAQAGDALLHGVSAFSPWDFGASLSQGRMIPLPEVLRGDVRGIAAPFDVVGRMVATAQAVNLGDYEQAAELASPMGIGAHLRAGRLEREGLRTQSGQRIGLSELAPGIYREELTPSEISGQRFGFTPTAVRIARERQQSLKVEDSRKTAMLRQLAKAYERALKTRKEVDRKALTEAFARINKYNEDRDIADQIPLETMGDYIRTRMEPAWATEIKSLPRRKRAKFMKRQGVWPGFGELPQIPAPPPQ